MSDKKLRLYFVAVNNCYGRNAFLPLAAGLMWGYARQFPEIDGAYEMCGMLYKKERIEDALAQIVDPDVVAFSSYIWNHEWNKALAKAVKAKYPDCLTLVGGVQVPNNSTRILSENPEFDFAIYGEGEGAFADFLRANIDAHDNRCFVGVGSLVYCTWDGFVVNERHAETPLEKIPSPYLEGLFDDILARDGHLHDFQMLVESNRGCPYASFAGDTIVALSDRLLRFDEEKYHSDESFTCKKPEHSHRVGLEDERLIAQGLGECVRIKCSNGLSTTVTLDHPMFVIRDEKFVDVRASEIVEGDWLPIEIGQNNVRNYVTLEEPSKTKWEILSARGIGQGRRVPDPINLPKQLTEDVAWLTGYVIGDGCLPKDDRSSMLLAVKDRSRDKLCALVPKLFGIPMREHKANNTEKMTHGSIHSRKVVQFFRESLGIEPLKDKLKVPRGLFRSPVPVVRAFLDGIWYADGYWPNSGEPYLATTSEQLANECAALIHWIGNVAVVRKLKTSEKSLSKLDFNYRVEWHGADCRSRLDGRPCIASRVPAIRHTYTSRNGELKLRHTPQDRNREGSPRSVLKYFEPNHPLLDERFAYVRVDHIENVGMVQTYDVHNHPEHKVAANGSFVRQCSFCEWGDSSLSKVNKFPEERILGEYEWAGKNKVEFIYSCDANVGILPRDIELTKALVETKAKYGYPKQMRAAFAKNSNDVVFEISKMLSDAGMLKATTLALQSMDDNTLVQIKRKNIKYEKLQSLSQRYEDAGIATYSELIVGLPGETLDTFVDGVDALLEAGQHTGISIYLCMLLENTEMATKESREKHGIKSAQMKALLYHGTPQPGIVEEIQETVIGTNTMPEKDLRMSVLYGWVVQAFHSFGLTQYLARKLHDDHGIAYQDFYLPLMAWFMEREHTVGGTAIKQVANIWFDAVEGKSWGTVDKKFGDVMWPPEEFLFLNIACKEKDFYLDLAKFCASEGYEIGPWVIEQQHKFIPPEYGKEEEYAREAVWYGRKGPGEKLRVKS